ncbi:MAG: amidohydrolase [Candidatus Riflebacteria bacterium]|nr:amidohydrolase [Candidatus Riflebacteria bacterium]
MSIDVKRILESLEPAVREQFEEMVRVRRQLHRHPELGLKEFRTADFVAERLGELGCEVHRMAGTGVVGLLRGGSPGKTLLLRADIDALPLQETNPADYCSQVPGVMHACGHDAHTSTALAVAGILSAERGQLHGNVKFMFQPAEEGPGGAERMLEEGLLEEPKVDAAFALHVWNDLPVGTVSVRPGPVMAAADEILITILGKGGHGAAPHEAVDPIVVAAHVVTALQTVPSRQVDPIHPVVVSICSVHAGQAFNIIPPDAELIGTVRSFDPSIREKLPGLIEKTVQGVTAAFGARYRFHYRHGYPPTVNDPGMADLVRGCARGAACVQHVVDGEVSMGGEDMAYVLRRVPGCYFMVGSGNPDRGIDSPHHSPTFDVDEHCMAIGAEVFCRIVRQFLAPG